MRSFLIKRSDLVITIALIIAWNIGKIIFGNGLMFNVIFFGSAIVIAIFVGLVWGKFTFRSETNALAKRFHEVVSDVKNGNKIIDELYEMEKYTINKWQDTNISNGLLNQLITLLARRWAGDSSEKEYIKWAQDALDQNLDTPSIRLLAGLNHSANKAEVEQYFQLSLKDISIQEPSQDEMFIHYFHYMCRFILAGKITPDHGIDLIHKRVVTPLGHPDKLMPWCFLWEGNDPATFAELKGGAAERDNLIRAYASKELEPLGLAKTKFNMYQRVRVATFIKPHEDTIKGNDEITRAPLVGDEGAIVDIYQIPREGYCVECTNDKGTLWIDDFLPDELETA